ncbi:molybdopterin-dependent oxidoreductase [Actinospica acidiphila]|uniref:molybdopterin-dependent oxidoreductase n=1 Tax=Streptomyces TaxID=1883 RepID=UPI000EF5A573|nr:MULTISPECIES: molybdopterin-dependent oxidoreductase [unclassified Streptomyces]MBQ0969826.1 molybdopterin-dependent oxidoreductase [Streptomyces sp. RK31]MBU5946292.1 molybdopterin-dependent oxidoreductase [Streptomyces sp. PAM3C]MUT93312.1 molybdopterin-dependent oxidoreductase [Streptomyces sp. Z38]NEA83085.1 molybdopterin-dependent oxidoreductase [Actinospica acidiphila]
MARSSLPGRLPRGPFSPDFWRSPLRGTWFTSVLGVVLLAGITILFVTGLVSYAAYNPDLSPVNDRTPGKGILGFYLFSWPTDPPWLYRLTQGVHVTLGLGLVPVLLAKLWSVVPKLFTLPPARSVTHALERLSLILLVGGALFQFVTGILNIQLDYIFPGSFYPLHFYGAWVFFGAFLAHVVLKAPAAFRNLRRMRSGGGEEPDEELTAARPAPPTVSRRGALGLVGGGSLLLVATSAGRSFDGPLRQTAVLTPHGGPEPGSGPGAFQVNKTAEYAGIRPGDTTEEAWRLAVTGRTGTVRLSRADLLAMDQHDADLPIACVEGWSTSDQAWRGVRLRDLAALVGHDEPADVYVESLQLRGTWRHAALSAGQVADGRSLLALSVNGADLTPDHGHPARVIVPAAPGVLNTKWVTRLTFGEL